MAAGGRQTAGARHWTTTLSIIIGSLIASSRLMISVLCRLVAALAMRRKGPLSSSSSSQSPSLPSPFLRSSPYFSIWQRGRFGVKYRDRSIDRWSLICRRSSPAAVGQRRQHPQFGIVPRVLGMEIYAEFWRMSCNSPFFDRSYRILLLLPPKPPLNLQDNFFTQNSLPLKKLAVSKIPPLPKWRAISKLSCRIMQATNIPLASNLIQLPVRELQVQFQENFKDN